MNNGINFPSLEVEKAFFFLSSFSTQFKCENCEGKFVMKEVKLAESTFLVLLAQLLFNQLKIVYVYEG